MDKLTCLISYMKFPMDEAAVNAMRQTIEAAGNRFVYDPSSNWNICCWQHDDDIYELDSFPVGEDVKEYARANVWKCIGCHIGDGGCPPPGRGTQNGFWQRV